MYYKRKVSWAFYLNFPQFNEVRKSDHVVVIGTTVTLVDLRAVKLAQGEGGGASGRRANFSQSARE